MRCSTLALYADPHLETHTCGKDRHTPADIQYMYTICQLGTHSHRSIVGMKDWEFASRGSV